MDTALVNYWQDLTRNVQAALASGHDRQPQQGQDDCSMEDKGLLEDLRLHMEIINYLKSELRATDLLCLELLTLSFIYVSIHFTPAEIQEPYVTYRELK